MGAIAKTNPLKTRVTRALAVMDKLDKDGFKVAGFVTGATETILILDHTARCKRLMGSVRRTFRDATGSHLELEVVMDGIRVRWIQPYNPSAPAPGVH